jgi:hypothetical protein
MSRRISYLSMAPGMRPLTGTVSSSDLSGWAIAPSRSTSRAAGHADLPGGLPAQRLHRVRGRAITGRRHPSRRLRRGHHRPAHLDGPARQGDAGRPQFWWPGHHLGRRGPTGSHRSSGLSHGVRARARPPQRGRPGVPARGPVLSLGRDLDRRSTCHRGAADQSAQCRSPVSREGPHGALQRPPDRGVPAIRRLPQSRPATGSRVRQRQRNCRALGSHSPDVHSVHRGPHGPLSCSRTA